MSKFFVVKFPFDMLPDEKEKFIKIIDSQSFMLLPHYTNAHQLEFMTYGDADTAKSIKENFKLPAGCEVIETTDLNH